MIETILEVVLHFDRHLNMFVQYFGIWTYLILFLIIFAETGLVIMPFLPGDSLLFVVGALAAAGSFDVFWLIFLLSVAGIIGDSVNYAIGKYFSDRVINKTLGKFIKKEHLDRTHSFYEKYGGKTIVIARFVPIVRTFAPFVAGIGKMSYMKFAIYNVLGGILWVSSIVLAGYYFGNIRMIKENFSLIALGIIFVSILPFIIEYLRYRLGKKTNKTTYPKVCNAEEKQVVTG
ncbi:MAG: DedA family protein [Elusimicrobiota bacterium]